VDMASRKGNPKKLIQELSGEMADQDGIRERTHEEETHLWMQDVHPRSFCN